MVGSSGVKAAAGEACKNRKNNARGRFRPWPAAALLALAGTFGIAPRPAAGGPSDLPPVPCAVWVVRNALESPETWNRALAAVERVGCRAVYLQVSGRWDAYFPSAVFARPASGTRGWEDPLASALADARARGIAVHAWVNAMLAWSAPDPPTDPDHVWRRHPEWFVSDAGGRSMRDLDRADLDRAGLRGEGWFLDPARAEVRTELRRFVLELVRRYPVDGIHLDYIRYPAGWAPPGGDAELTRLVALLREDLRVVRPAAVLTAAVLPRPAESRRSFGQDWAEWLRRGLVDAVAPMVYRESPEAVARVVEDYPADLPRDRIWVGLRIDRLDPAAAARTAERLAELGIGGVALFSHNLLLEDAGWARVAGW